MSRPCAILLVKSGLVPCEELLREKLQESQEEKASRVEHVLLKPLVLYLMVQILHMIIMQRYWARAMLFKVFINHAH